MLRLLFAAIIGICLCAAAQAQQATPAAPEAAPEAAAAVEKPAVKGRRGAKLGPQAAAVAASTQPAPPTSGAANNDISTYERAISLAVQQLVTSIQIYAEDYQRQIAALQHENDGLRQRCGDACK